jgi:hypothetical protein
MKISKLTVGMVLGLGALGIYELGAADSLQDFTDCKVVKLISEGRESVVTLCEKPAEQAPQVPVIRPHGRYAS